MKIILKEDIIGLGYKNEVVEVKDGYGRNYLIPKGKGVIASPSALKVLAENLRQQAHKIEVQKAAAEKRAAQLEGVALEIPAKVSATALRFCQHQHRFPGACQERHRGRPQNHHHARHQDRGRI